MSDAPAAYSLDDGVVVDVDRERLARALRRNTAFLLTWLGLLVAAVAVTVVFAIADIGRTLTYTLLVVLVLAVIPNILLGLFLRRRVRGFQRLPGPFLVVDRAGATFAGIPPIAWADMLGVVYGDSSHGLRSGGRFARWAKGLIYRAGGSQIMITVGLVRPKRFQRPASGALRRYFSAGMDLGGLIIPVDTALGDGQLALLRAALRAGTAVGRVEYLETTDTAAMGRAGYLFASGKRLNSPL